MDTPRPIIAVNYYFGQNELNNRIFEHDCKAATSEIMKALRSFLNKRGVDVVTIDTVDFHDPNVRHVVYFDYNWRLVHRDPFLFKIPFEKRALVIIEPANINPSLYYTSLLRNLFCTVFTWDFNLLRKNPKYIRINVPMGAEPRAYREHRFKDIAFADKKFLVAVSMNRWSYMPQSTYSLRKRAYSYFERAFPDQFDLFGMGWNAPSIFYEKWFGHPLFSSWRGPIDNTSDAKVHKIAEYKFALCFENNASEPGYISEKIIDCFCGRCVPVYYGSKGTDELIPRDSWIDLRDFRNLVELKTFLCSMDESRYNQYVSEIDRFMKCGRIDYFSNSHLMGVIADRLGFLASQKPATKEDML